VAVAHPIVGIEGSVGGRLGARRVELSQGIGNALNGGDDTIEAVIEARVGRLIAVPKFLERSNL
jgi:hypothetical protein